MIGPTMNVVLARWNGMEAGPAEAEVLSCCGSRAWARGLAGSRPLNDKAALLAASDSVWWGLAEEDWCEAFGSHPRIGERKAEGVATEQSLRWSGQEQSTALNGNHFAEPLAIGNRAYEARFGRTFITLASGRRGDEILAELERRMQNGLQVEMREAAEQQRRITRLRLERWMGAE